MATPRKAWFRVADSVAVENWSNDELAALIRLQAMMNTRWARDGKEGAEAASITLRPVDLMAMCGKRRLDVARSCASALARLATITVEHRDDVTVISWPKFANFQRYASESRDDQPPRLPPPPPPPPHPPHPPPKKRREPAVAGSSAPPVLRLEPPPAEEPKPARRKREASLAPEDLEGEQLDALWSRIWRAAPWLLVPRMAEVSHHCHPRWVRSEVRACLAHFRGIGEKRPDWPATCAAWVLKDDGREWKQQREAPPSALHFHATERAPEYVPIEVAEACARAAKGAA